MPFVSCLLFSINLIFIFLCTISLSQIGKGTSSKASAAKKVATSLKKGNGRKATRVHTKVHFYKPKTLALNRAPKIETLTAKRASKKVETSKAYDVVKYPLTTETAMKNVEVINVLKNSH